MSSLSIAAHEIVQAFVAHAKWPTQVQLDALMTRSRIPVWALAGGPDEFGVGFAHIELLASRFEFVDQGGEPAMVVIARDLCGNFADIVAWPLRGHAWIASWMGGVAMLGAHNTFAARLDPALTVHRSVFDWLRDHRNGVVLIDETRAAIELRDAGPLRAADVDHGLQLQALLTPPMPSIIVPATRERRAA